MDKVAAGQIEAFRAAFEALPERTRAVFRLHAVEGEDYGAVAARLGIDAGEVEARLAEALVALVRALGTDAP